MNSHNADNTKPGQMKILFFNKSIKPKALSANPERFQDSEKTEKGFNKNTDKEFLGGYAIAKEKGDILTYLTNM